MRASLVTLVLLATAPLVSSVGLAQDDPVVQVTNDFQSVDQSTRPTSNKGVVDWFVDKTKDALTHTALGALFGESAEPAEQAVNLYNGEKQLLNDASSTIQQSSPNTDPNQNPARGNAAQDKFWNGTLQNDVLDIVPGGSTFKNIVQGAQTAYNNVVAAGNAVADTANQITTKVNSYLNGSSDYGLQPASSDSQAAQQAVDSGAQPMAVTASDLPPDATNAAAQPATAQQPPSPPGQQAGSASGSASASAASGASASASDGTAPSTTSTGPNSEDEQNPTVAPISMASSDPNSCIRDSSLLGVPAVTIDCSSPSSDSSANAANNGASPDMSSDMGSDSTSPPNSNSADDQALLDAANQRMNAQQAAENAAAAQSQSMQEAADMQQLQQIEASQAAAAASSTLSGAGGSCPASAGLGVERCRSLPNVGGICLMTRRQAACLQSAMSSCGNCAICRQEAQQLIASLRATAASVCAN